MKFLVLGASLWLTTLLAGQPPAAHGEVADPQLHARAEDPHVRRIGLDVVVTGKGAMPVRGLQASDFQVLDNKNKMTLQQFRPMTSPGGDALTVGLVLDAINLSHESLARAKEQIRSFVGENGGHLEFPVSILILTDTEPKLRDKADHDQSTAAIALRQRQAFVRRIPASKDGAVLRAALDETDFGLSRILEAQGGEGQSERVRLSLQALNFIATAEAGTASRKILIWIGLGWPLLAQTDARSKEQLFDTVLYFSNLLRDARITLDMVNPDGIDGGGARDGSGLPPSQVINGQATRSGPMARPSVPGGPTSWESFLKGVKTAKQADANDLALQVLAHQTGGLILQERNRGAEEMKRCVVEAAASYELTYELPASAGGEQYHEVAIKLNRPGMEARTFTGFYTK